MKFNEIGDREFNEALNLNFEEVKKSIQILEKQLLNDRAE